MVIDSSALLAMLLGEPEAIQFAELLGTTPDCVMSALTLLETSVVISARKGPAGLAALDQLIHAANIQIVPFDADQCLVARATWDRFGKGRHPAQLNLGDCCSYALATTRNDALLCKGNDFRQTDLTLA